MNSSSSSSHPHTTEFDPRAWNLLAGLAVVAGCPSNPSVDADNGETAIECTMDADCPSGYACYEGVCQYVPSSDGIPYYGCYTDSECETLQVCESEQCQAVDPPPVCEMMVVEAPPFEISEPILQIAFVDIDDDGGDELIVGTQTQLHVYQTGAAMPGSHPRGVESAEIDAMVGGTFDDMPGSDVIVLHGDQLDLHASDGQGALAPAASLGSPYMGMRGLTPGAFDMESTTDMLLWGSFSIGVRYGSGEVVDILLGDITSADARDLGQPGSGFAMLRGSELLVVDYDGTIAGSALLHGIAPAAQASYDVLGDPLEMVGSSVEGWTIVEIFDRASVSVIDRFGIPENNVSYMRAGDLDGLDEIDEVAVIADGELSLYISNECLLPHSLGTAVVNLVFGDHDGDGDDELAVATAANTVSIVDVE